MSDVLAKLKHLYRQWLLWREKAPCRHCQTPVSRQGVALVPVPGSRHLYVVTMSGHYALTPGVVCHFCCCAWPLAVYLEVG